MSWLGRLKEGLRKSTQNFTSGILQALGGHSGHLTHEQVEAIFEMLIQSDVGTECAQKICEHLKKQSFASEKEALQKIADEIAAELRPFAQPFSVPRRAASQKSPHVILVSGVNGSGKTTSIAKLTYLCKQQGLRVAWAACDTFRAAATHQLRVWADCLDVPLYDTYPGQGARVDPASLAYHALETTRKEGAEVLFIDTAGRLHNNEALMGELARIVKVLRKLDEETPHQSLLVLDGTTGQNALIQVELFRKYIPLTGLVLTKLDGTSRAGFFLPLCQKLSIPVVAVGVGEQMEAMNAFNPDEFAAALLGLRDEASDNVFSNK